MTPRTRKVVVVRNSKRLTNWLLLLELEVGCCFLNIGSYRCEKLSDCSFHTLVNGLQGQKVSP